MTQAATKFGIVEGVLNEEKKVVLFAGVPYAAPPVGDLRWKAPQAPEPWEGVKDCTKFGGCCPQPVMPISGKEKIMCYGPEYFITPESGLTISEDCLYLNIWAPENADKCPVIVIIHGGGFSAGTGAVPILNGEDLASKGIVAVTINYRVGIFGYLCHPELSAENPQHISGNYGFMDQVAAMKWVRENIAAFGGDPDNITAAGESGGAMSVSLLYQYPGAKDTFQKVVAQSGALLARGCWASLAPLSQIEQIHKALVENAGYHSIKELRAASAEELLAVAGKWEPVGDEVYWFSEENRKGYSDAAMLIGSNSDEGIIFTGGIQEETAPAIVSILYGEDAGRIVDYYSAKAAFPEWLQNLDRDAYFGHQMYTWAQIEDRNGTKPVYLYYFDRAIPEIGYGAFHTSELEYFYGTRSCTKVAWEETDEVLERNIQTYLVNFLKTGDPNGEGVPEWKPFGEEPEQVMELGVHTGMIPHPQIGEMEFLSGIKSRGTGMTEVLNTWD